MGKGFIQRAQVGQLVEFRTKQGDLLSGKVVHVAGEVYTVKLGPQETKPVHHKYLTKINTAPGQHEAVAQ